MKILKSSNILLGILLVHLILITFIHNNLYPIHFVSQNIFFLDLIGIRANIPYGLLVFFEAANLFLLWLVSKRIFTGNFSLIPPIIYAISPWNSYLVAAGSFYIYLSFLVLLTFYSLFLIRSGCRFWGSILLVGFVIIAAYSSFLLFLILPIIFILLIIFKIIPFVSSNFLKFSLIILLLPLLFIILCNKPGFKSIFNNEIKVFEDPGLMNMVNSYQGAANQQGFGKPAKLSENKYLFFTEYILLKFTKQFVPSTIFTSQEKLLNFSFSPPIYLGFIIPFIYGLYQILKLSIFWKILLLSTMLVVPSVFAKQIVDLNRLIIFAPVVILVISYGLSALYTKRKKKIALIFLVTTLFLVIFQSLVTFSDIQTREKDRFIKYFNQNFEVSQQ